MLIRILSIGLHKAARTYYSSEGVIKPGDFYYRGFALTNTGVPFEFVIPQIDYNATCIPQRVFENGIKKAFKEEVFNAGKI